jgi:hypothetical protein
MAIPETRTAADQYTARVDAVLAQRTRLRGPQPPGDLFAGLPADHPMLTSDPRRPLDPNLERLASYIAPDDVVIYVGGGAGRVSLPLALRCREVINVEPSGTMGAGFTANATRTGITNVRVLASDWLSSAPPVGTVALVTHVAYLTREIVPFLTKLEEVGRRRVLIMVNGPPPPSWHRVLYHLLYGEPEEVVPGHVELVNVLWELGILPDVHVLQPSSPPRPVKPLSRGPWDAFAGTSGPSGPWGWSWTNSFATSWRHASTTSLLPVLTALAPGGLRPVVKSSSPGSPPRERRSLARSVKAPEPEGKGVEPHGSPEPGRTLMRTPVVKRHTIP